MNPLNKLIKKPNIYAKVRAEVQGNRRNRSAKVVNLFSKRRSRDNGVQIEVRIERHAGNGVATPRTFAIIPVNPSPPTEYTSHSLFRVRETATNTPHPWKIKFYLFEFTRHRVHPFHPRSLESANFFFSIRGIRRKPAWFPRTG